VPFLRRLAFAAVAVRLIVLGLIADGIVSRLDPRVRSSHGRAW
jgi:hypothetical protein